MSGRNSSILIVAAAVLLSLGLYMALIAAPTERTMGVVQRIFYFHVSSAWTAFVAFFLNTIGSVLYLMRRRAVWDSLAVSGAEVGVVFCSVVLVTGPLWAKPVWGIWWTWDARLTSTLVLWLLYVAYLLLRSFLQDAERRALISAVFGVFAFADVPIVYMSIRWWRTQHPQPVIAGGPRSGLNPQMWYTLLACWAALMVLMVCYLRLRMPLEEDRRRLELLRRQMRVPEPI